MTLVQDFPAAELGLAVNQEDLELVPDETAYQLGSLSASVTILDAAPSRAERSYTSETFTSEATNLLPPPNSYRYHEKDKYAGDMHVAIWAPTVEKSNGGEVSSLGLVLVEYDTPKNTDKPFLSSAIEELARMSERSPEAANLLAILGIVASAEHEYGANHTTTHARLVSTFPDIATLNTRLRWIGEQLKPRDSLPNIVAAKGEYPAQQFMERWANDEVLMSAATNGTEEPDDESVLFAAHDMLTHALAWATLTSATRQTMRIKQLAMSDIDVLASIVGVSDLFAPGRIDPTMLMFSSAGVFDPAHPLGPNHMLNQQLTRITALKNLPKSPFPDPRDTLVSNFSK